ncbi:NUDIX hydrolase [Rubritalea marina]|uniref:NUDIX hydrolase n=1 Tax=Rubritalea marina TaxID=361055 RepID=UPI00036298A2|nr:NUDIX hydrolase [Rubritalea marina]
MTNDDVEVLHEGKYLGLYRRGNWEFALRPQAAVCATILPLTDAGEVVLVEQFRVPMQCRVIEVPAGLVGDEPEFEGETVADCAARELLEETGFRAGKMIELIASPTSAGMTPEVTHMFAATGIVREHAGGGVDGEDIQVHVVPVAELNQFLADQQAAGHAIDFKIHASMYQAGVLGLLGVS